MEDSMEDFIRLCRNTRHEKPTKNKEDVQTFLQRKKECDVRALRIVEVALEGKLRPEVFTRCLSYINQSHYQDIVEERAITKLCGYSICGKNIPDMPEKQYHISTKSNKVFDITERKNFCSNHCYKASLHIKKQLDDSPLWLRKLEEIPEYQLLGSNESGLPGEYVCQGIARPVVEDSFTSVSAFTEVSLNDVIDKEIGREKVSGQNKDKGSHKKISKLVRTMQTISEQLDDEESDSSKENIEINNAAQNQEVSCSTTLPIIVEKDENGENYSEETKITTRCPGKLHSKKNKRKAKSSSKVDAEALIKKIIKDWFSLETYIFLYGEKKVKQILDEKKMGDLFEELNISKLHGNQQAKYMDICKRLHIQEMADEKFDQAIIGNPKLKPPPDFQRLKEDSKDMNIKVKCFFNGTLQEREDTNFPTKINNEEAGANSEEYFAVLPLVDVNSQKAMRRKIFLNAINKSMHQLLQAFRVSSFTWILTDLQQLVKTFRLRADNIVFNTAIWQHIALVLLFILSIKDLQIKNILDEPASQEYIKLHLSTLPSKEAFLSDIIMDVQNIEMFVERFISTD